MQTLSFFPSWLKSQSKWSNHSRIRVTTLNSFNNVCAPLSSVPENIEHKISSPSQMSPLSSKRWLNLWDLDNNKKSMNTFLPLTWLSRVSSYFLPRHRLGHRGTWKVEKKIQENAIRLLQINYYLQGKGFSPVWRLLRWACSRELSTNPFSQKSHLYFLSLSSVCDTFMCLQRLVKVPPQ